MGLDLYYSVLSQPSRSVLMFLKKHEIQFNGKKIELLKGENKTPEYLAINPHHTVPVAVDDGFIMRQSGTIVKYLASKFKTPDHWYPADIQKRARVDEIMDWYPSTIRKNGINVFFYIAVGPHIGMPTLTEEEIDKRYKELDVSLTTLENVYLKEQTFLCGDEITIADMFCANEVFQPSGASERDIYKTHPRLKAWMGRVREKMNPVWDEVIEEFRVLIKGYQTAK